MLRGATQDSLLSFKFVAVQRNVSQYYLSSKHLSRQFLPHDILVSPIWDTSVYVQCGGPKRCQYLREFCSLVTQEATFTLMEVIALPAEIHSEEHPCISVLCVLEVKVVLVSVPKTVNWGILFLYLMHHSLTHCCLWSLWVLWLFRFLLKTF